MQASLSHLSNLLNDVLSVDRYRLTREHQRLQRLSKKPCDIGDELMRLTEKITASAQRVNHRRQLLPAISYPQLPIIDKREQIADTVAQHQVVVLAGETGSGKTTQLPKICLDIGRGVRGMIGHTQPRRLAARTVANRIADELGVAVGESVGYQVRFTDKVSPNTHIKLMTDGILLSETQQDRFLSAYDTLIIDEAHERSLNIDFLLGYLKQLLPRRPDLKVIITSATIDVERFSQHFDQAPVIEVCGRTYPVEVRYRPVADMESDDIYSGLLAAVDELLQMDNNSRHNESDILVFLSGEGEINEATRQLQELQIPHTEVLPLYAKLSTQQQNRIFQPHRGRRIILATNVAETSITVPGIRYVIDTGYARISRYSFRHKIQRLPIEPISQASANQRAGRCGRVSEGVCIRLYSEEDFLNRAKFTEAEILRTNLAAVILQMLRLGLGDISSFPFVDKPDQRLIGDGLQLLQELQAIGGLSSGKSSAPTLTALGRRLANLPLDPRLGRMLLAAGEHSCVREILIIISAMEIQDPRQYPADKKQAAEQQHRQYWHPDSDFMAYINLWDSYQQQQQALSKNQLKQWCKRSFLSFLRMYEWVDIHRQLTIASKSLGLTINTEPALYDAIHQSLLTGLLGQVGLLDDESGEYIGARNCRFKIFPGSSLFKKQSKHRANKPHRWIVAGQLVETRQLYAHQVAKIEAAWLLESAAHLIKRHYYEPHYHAKSGAVMAFEKISLYGLVIAEKKRTSYSRIDQQQAREIFIRAALVEGRYGLHPQIKHQLAKYKEGPEPTGHFFLHQQTLIREIQELETKSRRRDILADDQVIYDFYQQRIPATINNISAFEHWRKQIEKAQPGLLFIDREQLMQHDAIHISEAQFPKQLTLVDTTLPLVYHFEPGHPDDGVSLQAPISLLHLIPDHRLQWLVPGLLREKLIAIVKALPKQWRKHFVPVPAVVDRALANFKRQFQCSPTFADRPLLATLGEQLYQQTGTRVPVEVWQSITIDDYYYMNIQLMDDCGECIDRGRDLAVLRQNHRNNVQQTLQTAGNDIERDNITCWDFDTLPESCHLNHSGVTTVAYPALVDKGDSVSLLLQDNPIDARYQSLSGVARLALLSQRDTVKYLKKQLLKSSDLVLGAVDMGSRSQVIDNMLLAAMRHTYFSEFSLPMHRQQFVQAIEQGRGQFVKTAETMADLLLSSLEKAAVINRKIDQLNNPSIIAAAIADIRQQLANLFYPGCLYETPYQWLSQFPRYLEAICLRIDKVASQIEKDRLYIEEMDLHWQRYVVRLREMGKAQCLQNKALVEYRWLIEELRISLFAQTIKTLRPVSTKRLNKHWDFCQLSGAINQMKILKSSHREEKIICQEACSF